MNKQSIKKELSTEEDEPELQLKFNLKETWAKQRKNMFKITPGGYIFDRLIFNVAMFLIFSFLFFVAYSYNFNLDYYKCTDGAYIQNDKGLFIQQDNLKMFEPGSCKNPFYKPASWRNEQYLPPGEYGTKPGLLFNSMSYIVFFILAGSFVLNHFLYNNKREVKK